MKFTIEQSKKANFVKTDVAELLRRLGWSDARYVIGPNGEYVVVYSAGKPAFLIDVSASSLTKERHDGGMQDIERGLNNPEFRITGSRMKELLRSHKEPKGYAIAPERMQELLKELVQDIIYEYADRTCALTLLKISSLTQEDLEALGFDYLFNIVE